MNGSTAPTDANCGCAAEADAALEGGHDVGAVALTLADIEREVHAARRARRREANAFVTQHNRGVRIAKLSTLTQLEVEIASDRAAKEQWTQGIIARAEAGAGASGEELTIAEVEREVNANRAARIAWVQARVQDQPGGSWESSGPRAGEGAIVSPHVASELAAHRAAQVAWRRAMGLQPMLDGAHEAPLDIVLADLEGWMDCYPELAWRMGRGVYGFGELEFDATVEWKDAEREFSPEPSTTASETLAAEWQEALAQGRALREPITARLLLAVSPDGKRWTKTGEIIANHASVPCLAVENDRLYLFFNTNRELAADVDGVLGGADQYRPTPLAVATTTDLVTWNYRLIGDHGEGIRFFETLGWDTETLCAQDPSVVSDRHGGWLLYFTLHTGAVAPFAATYVASASTLEGPWTQGNRGQPVFPLDGVSQAEDPSVCWMPGPGHYVYFAGDVTPPPPGVPGTPQSWAARFGPDGTNLEPGSGLTIAPKCDGLQLIPSNPLDGAFALTGVVTWYAFVSDSTVNPPVGNFIVATTVDENGSFVGGVDGVAEACNPLIVVDRDYEFENVKDAAVVRFRDCYVMVYVAGIPPEQGGVLPEPVEPGGVVGAAELTVVLPDYLNLPAEVFDYSRALYPRGPWWRGW